MQKLVYQTGLVVSEKMLYTNGFRNVWESQSVVNENHLLASFIQSLKNKHLQNWFARIDLSSKLIT